MPGSGASGPGPRSQEVGDRKEKKHTGVEEARGMWAPGVPAGSSHEQSSVMPRLVSP